jgi:hypothetical protein
MTAGNNELFAASPALEIVRKYLGGSLSDKPSFYDARLLMQKQKRFFDARRWARPAKKQRRFLSLFRGRYADPVDARWDKILGSYAFGKNDVAILPLVLRVMQNNLDLRLQTISLVRERNRLILIYTESGESFCIPIGLYDYEQSRLRIRDELFIVRAIGEVVSSSEGDEYRIELVFSETASVRRISIKKIGKGRLSVNFSETPNERLLRDYLANLSKKNGAIALGGSYKPLASSAKFYRDDEVLWLARIIHAESSGEPMLGKIAVGNVVLNRVSSAEFPYTIPEVIFDRVDGIQFEPVENGSIYKVPSALSVSVAKQVLDGADTIGEAMYFYAPALSQGLWINANRTYLRTIGCHRFYL